LVWFSWHFAHIPGIFAENMEELGLFDAIILWVPWQSVHDAAGLPSLSFCQWMPSLYAAVEFAWHFAQKSVTWSGEGFPVKFVCITFMEITSPLMLISPP